MVYGVGNTWARFLAWLDSAQARHAVLGFPYAVLKKYGDDQGGRHAALLTHYGFLSLFPLLLLVVTVMRLVLVNDPELQDRLVKAVVPSDLQGTVESAIAAMPSSGLPLAVGVVGLVLSGLGIIGATYETLNALAGVPFRSRYGFLPRTLRTLAALVLLVIGVAGVGAMTAVVGAVPTVPALSRLGLFVGGVLLTGLVIWGLVALLVPVRTHLSGLWPGLLVAAVAVSVLLTFGAALLPGFVTRSGPVYGSFATIVGLFALLALVFQAVVIAGEAAVVLRRGLWPRGLDGSRPTDADRRVLAGLAAQQERTAGQRVRTSFR
jgi:uncharacterized BrkB/YihY/UPF0761 family membrane protein